MAEVKKQKLSKKLPKRTGRRSAKRMGHKERAATKHMARKLAQFQREVHNNVRREGGIPTPWEIAKANRNRRRNR
jgi:hypothetical protein